MKNAVVLCQPLTNYNSFYSLHSCCVGSERKIKYGDCSLGERPGLVKQDSVLTCGCHCLDLFSFLLGPGRVICRTWCCIRVRVTSTYVLQGLRRNVGCGDNNFFSHSSHQQHTSLPTFWGKPASSASEIGFITGSTWWELGRNLFQWEIITSQLTPWGHGPVTEWGWVMFP